MSLYPNLNSFEELAEQKQYVPVAESFLCDGLTPVQAFHNIDEGKTGFLFESVIGGEKVGRFSFLGTEPFRQFHATGNLVTVESEVGRDEFETPNPLQKLRELIGEFSVAEVPGLPPFAGGAIGYAGYDVIRYVEHLPNAPEDDRNIPDMSFAFYKKMVVFDNVSKTMTIIVLVDTESADIALAYQNAQESIAQTVSKIQKTRNQLPIASIDTSGDPKLEYTSNFTFEQFSHAVRQCIEYINAGDIFQVVISQRLCCDLNCEPFEVYRTLRVVNPSPFMFFLRTPQTTLIGSSPEIMCRVVDDKVTVRPLAGTRKRGKTEEEDLALEKELLADPKERAEHIMLVDLGRNDVGKIAKYGTVEIPDIMVVERYSHVMHISSSVTGMLRDDLDSFDALAASLPAGTVSGAPKVRAMEIIDEFEPHRRGPYAGAVGYIDFNGNMDTCIALRTLVIDENKAYIQAGAGIVADSQPELEYKETINKARVLLKAIEISQDRNAK